MTHPLSHRSEGPLRATLWAASELRVGPGFQRPINGPGTLLRMSHGLTPWEEVRARVRALPSDARAVFAIAVTEHLVARFRPENDVLRSALSIGWQVALGGGGPLQTVREELERRSDLDEDEVAAVYFALGAAAGSVEDAEYAARRCTDAAFDRVLYPDGAAAFRPLEVDAAHDVVQEELHWETTALDLLETGGVTPDIISRLRA